MNDQLAIEPQRGRLVPLKTKGEIRATNETVDVYVVELPARAANAVLSVLRTALSDAATADLQHLRRVIKPDFLPAPALARLAPARVTPPPNSGETRLLLVSRATLIPAAELEGVLARHAPFAPAANDDNANTASFPLAIHVLPVPALAPTSAPQADAWSATYWPVAYKHTNPHGPHPSLVARAQAEIEPQAGRWLALAQRAALQAADRGLGPAVGCAVVERRLDGNGRAVEEGKLVAVAGDARRCGLLGEAHLAGQHAKGGHAHGHGGTGSGAGGAAMSTANGNVMNHAALRAIGMVAQKRLNLTTPTPTTKPAPAPTAPVPTIFADTPLTPLEAAVDALENTLAPSGYLCLDLEIYLSHEPCVMCSMAILHSRFGRCVFARRMPRSGGLGAEEWAAEAKADVKAEAVSEVEADAGHGLFWRPAELNWKFLTWQWRCAYGIKDGWVEK
ncbi:uncharacterized protein K452DRAFT_351896 [Aplosporella prunicola CBS 121167]|uniref:CMP/dCMP-type deaminase domain-containing protein n=1 Tax=Aplosporella prunicola CBS 121167 TaxID=1176127 RepID=A0A6A6B933_9PEZI|nr:uncharacterized protein K452DRAFT_351896 [Aplosporella prunicola CBS 121167]KAF2140699.1 hypothetical protein K452DRAFT_351896 [Aplosporella prunicola CBS 121167]